MNFGRRLSTLRGRGPSGELRLRSDRHIDFFFYDGPISRGTAFEDILSKGEYLADRLVGAFSEQRTWPQLVNIATDGETYGPHRPHGDMALAYALHHIESKGLARLIVLDQRLDVVLGRERIGELRT